MTSKLQLLTQLVLAAATDVGTAVLLAIWIMSQQHIHTGIGTFVVAGLMGVSCDLDLLGSNSHHQDWLHKPIIMIGLPLAIAYILPPDSSIWFQLWAACNSAHLIHDSLGDANSGGVPWLWPLFDKNFTFFISNHLITKYLGERPEILPLYIHDRTGLADPLPTKKWLRFYYGRVTLEMMAGVIILSSSGLLALITILN